MPNPRIVRASVLVAALAISITSLISTPASAGHAAVVTSGTEAPTPTETPSPAPTGVASPAPNDAATPPVDVPPTLSGVPELGSLLTVDPGSWPDDAVLTYQWYAGTTAIAGATGTTIKASPMGARIHVDVTGTLPDGTSTTRSSASTLRVGRTDLVQLSGEAATGGALKASTGIFWTTGASLTYDWFADGEPIPDAHGTLFVPGAALAGKQITVQVTAAAVGYPTLSRMSAATRPLMLAPTPLLLDDPFVEHTLTVDPGTWSAGTELSIRWEVGSLTVGTGPTLDITSAMYGKRIIVRVTGTNPTLGTYSRIRMSAPVQFGSVYVTGSLAVGETVKATGSGWFGGSTSYQWLRDGADISGATGQTYKILASDADHIITVRATSTGLIDSVNTITASLRSDPLGAVMRAGTPTLGAVPIVGKRATVSPGVWPAGTSFTYDWYAGNTWIQDAGPSVVVPDAWADLPVHVEVHANRSGDATVTRSTATYRAVRIPKPIAYGTFAVGGSANVETGQGWRQGTTLAYQWMRNGVAIPGETRWWHWVTNADQDKNLTVRVIAKIPDYGNVVQTTASPGRVTVAGGTPRVSGPLAVGSTLTATPDTWKAGTKLTYQWSANGVAIRGATSSRLALTSAQRGCAINVSVTGRLSGYATVTETSQFTSRVALAPPPTISGTKQVGYRLAANHGTWTAGTTFTYQWYANGRAITGATSAAFTLKAAQRGNTVTVKVTGRKSGYATISRMSAKTATIR